jgi:DNA ligase-1
MNCESIIKELESNNSRLIKEAIMLREAESNNTEFFEGCRMAYDAKITFGIKQVPEKLEGTHGKGLKWNEFKSVAELFIRREITGNMAKMALQGLMESATVDQWNLWYRRILIKDLRCGITDKTINSGAKKSKNDTLKVPVFECQLAHDGANHESKITGRKLIEVKLDGVRVITIVYPDGRIDQFSRNGKELVNFTHIKDQFAIIAKNISEPWVFDGEVMSNSFQDLMKQVHRKENVQAQDAVLYLFDYLPLNHFEEGSSFVPQEARSNSLIELIETYTNQMPNVRVLEHDDIYLDTPEGRQQFEDINRRAIAGGYEGIMIKDPNAPYECKRTTNWLKQKPFIEVSLTVVAVEEGTGRNQGRLGALVCEGEDSGQYIKVNVGSGFNDAVRDTIFNDHASVMGQVVEVRADAITQNQDGTYSLRFPRFLRFRGFEPGEKI